MWRKWNPPTMLVEMQAGTTAMTVWRFLKKLKTYHLAIPLLGIYWKKTVIPKDTYTPLFIAALFTIVNTWKRPKCPSTEKWIKKMWCTHTHTHTHTHNWILLSHKTKQNNVTCSNINGPRDYHTKSERERQISYITTYMWNPIKNDTNGLIYKTETNLQISQNSKSNLCLPKGKHGRKW